ncbi:hypothetical protein OS493_021116 [Desmophyllum pertusum]|uniref:Uncharacterized protein n=1 Tax=Desmophyllum pertusum TaxID=174260 RepID=A0A9W9ZMN6_9CNID|nr:hypothetical protein OS493_021116 [Desmophyllum pertusum]
MQTCCIYTFRHRPTPSSLPHSDVTKPVIEFITTTILLYNTYHRHYIATHLTSKKLVQEIKRACIKKLACYADALLAHHTKIVSRKVLRDERDGHAKIVSRSLA